MYSIYRKFQLLVQHTIINNQDKFCHRFYKFYLGPRPLGVFTLNNALNAFRLHENEKPAFLNSSGLKAPFS